MAGMIVLLLVIDTCMTVALAFRLSSAKRHIKRLERRHNDCAGNDIDGQE